jgi:hypothetical protein
MQSGGTNEKDFGTAQARQREAGVRDLVTETILAAIEGSQEKSLGEDVRDGEEGE